MSYPPPSRSKVIFPPARKGLSATADGAVPVDVSDEVLSACWQAGKHNTVARAKTPQKLDRTTTPPSKCGYCPLEFQSGSARHCAAAKANTKSALPLAIATCWDPFTMNVIGAAWMKLPV